jgi:hypothetical protein
LVPEVSPHDAKAPTIRQDAVADANMKPKAAAAIERDFSAPLGNTTEAERGGGIPPARPGIDPMPSKVSCTPTSAVHGLTLDRHETADYGIGRNDPRDRSNGVRHSSARSADERTTLSVPSGATQSSTPGCDT